jgi:transcriptional regulator with XRE-family HTH domain
MNDLLLKIRLLRLTLRVSQMEMANNLGIEQSTYSRMERGLSPMNISHLYAIAHFFRLHFDDFMVLSVEQLVVSLQRKG